MMNDELGYDLYRSERREIRAENQEARNRKREARSKKQEARSEELSPSTSLRDRHFGRSCDLFLWSQYNRPWTFITNNL
jgi:hypothetical protein